MRIIRNDEDLEVCQRTNTKHRAINAWPVLHFLGGICLHTVVVSTTGISAAFFFGSHDGSHEASSYYASINVLVMIVLVAIGYKLSSALLAHIDALQIPRLKRNLLKSVLPIAYFVCAIVLAMGLHHSAKFLGGILSSLA